MSFALFSLQENKEIVIKIKNNVLKLLTILYCQFGYYNQVKLYK